MTIWVETPARLHFGMFDLAGDLGRKFGGIGAAIAEPSLLLVARQSDTLEVRGPCAAEALVFAQRFSAAHGLRGGADIEVRRALPQHVGLGSGTQLGLAVARALAELYGLPTEAGALARAVARAQRSAIGTWVFAQGGLIVEGGRRLDEDKPAPLLMRHALPDAWRCVVVIPASEAGLSGAQEIAAFQKLPPPSPELVGQITRQVLMALLPALVEADIVGFGRALTATQRLIGASFSAAQGGRFANAPTAALVDALLAAGAAGAGQSSWGPTVYGVVADEQQGMALAERMRALLGGRGAVFVARFANAGARCWRE